MRAEAPHIADVRLTCFDDAVYEPAEDSFALVDALVADLPLLQTAHPRVCVEVGSGTGYVVTSAALLLQGAAACFATDINPRAAAATRATLAQHGVVAEVVLTDIVGALEPRLTGSIDLLLFNPPYVPSPIDEVGGARLSAAWAGGARGRVVVDRFLARVPALLSSQGALYMVAVTDNDVPDLLRCLRDMGLDARVCLERTADEERLHIISARRRRSTAQCTEAKARQVD